jgi:hypothetical protein
VFGDSWAKTEAWASGTKIGTKRNGNINLAEEEWSITKTNESPKPYGDVPYETAAKNIVGFVGWDSAVSSVADSDFKAADSDFKASESPRPA